MGSVRELQVVRREPVRTNSSLPVERTIEERRDQNRSRPNPDASQRVRVLWGIDM